MFARLIFFAVVLPVLLAGKALSFDPEPGHRASPVVGRDLISGKTVSLEEQRGKWVLLFYWASW